MRLTVLFLFTILLLSVSEKDRNKKKVSKQIKSVLSIENFELSNINVDNSIKEEIWDQFNYSKFKKIIHNDKLIGYSYESKAPSMHYEFDYLIILGLDLKIIDSKVLVYRENWGGEIGSKRWLKQFKHKGKDDLREMFESDQLEDDIEQLTGSKATSIFTDYKGHAGDLLIDTGTLVWLHAVHGVDPTTMPEFTQWNLDIRQIAKQVIEE